MNPAHLQILQHSLGVDKYGQGDQYRNRFVTGPRTVDWPHCRALTDAGLMEDHGSIAAFGGMHLFSVTPAGVDAVALQSPAPPKVSRSKQRYRDFLRSETSLSFMEWIHWTARRKSEA